MSDMYTYYTSRIHVLIRDSLFQLWDHHENKAFPDSPQYYVHVSIHIIILTYVHTYIHTYIHTHTHTHTHKHTHTHTHTHTLVYTFCVKDVYFYAFI